MVFPMKQRVYFSSPQFDIVCRLQIWLFINYFCHCSFLSLLCCLVNFIEDDQVELINLKRKDTHLNLTCPSDTIHYKHFLASLSLTHDDVNALRRYLIKAYTS